MKIKKLLLLGTMFLFVHGCNGEKPKESITEGGMKCGAGKCGASMVDGSALLVKKKINILNQLRENDTRRACVLKAITTKALYNCVRNAQTGRLTSKCSTANVNKKKEEVMKCESGKCNSGTEKKIPHK